MLPYLTAPGVYCLFGPDAVKVHLNIDMGMTDRDRARARRQNQVHIPAGMPTRISPPCLICREKVEVDFANYIQDDSSYRICQVGCSQCLAAHVDCLDDHLASHTLSRFCQVCSHCHQAVERTGTDGLSPQNWPSTIVYLFWLLFLRFVSLGAVFTFGLWATAYALAQFGCLTSGHFCTMDEMKIPRFDELAVSGETRVKHYVLAAWFVGVTIWMCWRLFWWGVSLMPRIVRTKLRRLYRVMFMKFK